MKGPTNGMGTLLGLIVLVTISWSMMLMPHVAVEAVCQVSCQEVVSQLSACSTFLRNPDDSVSPSPQCCLGAQALDKIASASKSDSKIMCQCLKVTAQSDTSINFNNAKKLPNSCQLQTKIPIDPNFDCNTI